MLCLSLTLTEKKTLNVQMENQMGNLRDNSYFLSGMSQGGFLGE